MRTPLWPALLAFALVACRSPSKSDQGWEFQEGMLPTPTTPIVTFGGPARARVVSVNHSGRFVVLSFPIGPMPAAHRRFGVYREGMKVGELRVSGPQHDNNTVADILVGECRVGDEAREE